jgi:hypothetical protein
VIEGASGDDSDSDCLAAVNEWFTRIICSQINLAPLLVGRLFEGKVKCLSMLKKVLEQTLESQQQE